MSVIPIVRTVWYVSHALWETGIITWLLANEDAVETPPLTVRRLQVIHEPQNQPTGVEEDVRITTHDFINLTDGTFDDTWTEADFLAVEGPMDTFWTNLQNTQADNLVSEYRWYRVVPGEPRTGPPVRIVSKAIASTRTDNPLPPQVSITVTEKTALRKHWGRFYIPQIGVGYVDAFGRVAEGGSDVIANAAETFYESVHASANEIVPVVLSHSRKSALAVGAIQVDDVFDIIRRRRWESVARRTERVLAV